METVLDINSPDPESDHPVSFRTAQRPDVPRLVEMLADDPLGSQRESYQEVLPASYYKAYDSISNDPNNDLVVAIQDKMIVGFMQITFIPYLTYRGRWRALIESVRVDRRKRGSGIGAKLINYAIEKARSRECHVVQLTTDKQRKQAHSFYQSLGFVASHEGMKLHLA